MMGHMTCKETLVGLYILNRVPTSAFPDYIMKTKTLLLSTSSWITIADSYAMTVYVFFIVLLTLSYFW